MFSSLAEENAKHAIDIFEALDLEVPSGEFFVKKCKEMPKEYILNLRDIRPGNYGRTLLHNAARNGKLSAVLFLIRMGCAVDLIDSRLGGVTPLMDAITFKNIDIAVVLVEAGASVSKVDTNGENALHYAARAGSTRTIRGLLKAANLRTDEIQELASATNIKLQFPEDLAQNSMVKDVLVNFREQGAHTSLFRKKSRKSTTIPKSD